MTGPQTIDWLAQYGPQSDMFRQEQALFDASRDAALGRIMGTGTPAGALTAAQAAIRTAPQQWHDEDLVGAAVYWGVPEQAARQMPRDQLIAMVGQFRNAARPADLAASKVASTLAPLAQFGVGFGEAITGGLQKLPIIGEIARKSQWVHDADMYLRKLEEGVRSSTPESMQGVESVANMSGNLGAMWVPGNTAWKMAGVVGKVIPFGLVGGTVGPIARAGFQGGAAAWMLGGANEHSSQESMQSPSSWSKILGAGADDPLQNLGFGALLGSAGRVVLGGDAAAIKSGEWLSTGIMGAVAKKYAPQIAALANKVTNVFMPKDVLQPGDLSGVGAPQGAGGPALAEAANAPGPMTQLRQMAAGGDQQAQMMLNHIESSTPAAAQSVPDWAPGSQTAWEGGTDNARASWLGEHGHQNTTWDQLTPAQQAKVGAATGYLKPPEVHSINPDDLAAQMNKAASIVQSPLFGEIGGRTQIDESAVAEAVIATNPGGTNIVQGVGNPGKLAAELNPESLTGVAAQHETTGRIISQEGFDGGHDALPIPKNQRTDYQMGYTTSTGRFVGRQAAREIAVNQRQVRAGPDAPTSSVLKGSLVDQSALYAEEVQFAAPPQQNVRFARRGTRLDAIVSDKPITDSMISNYETHGVYEGQRVLTASGISGEVQYVMGSHTLVKPTYGDIPVTVPTLDLHPWTTSPSIVEVPQLWNEFNSYVGARVGATAEAMGNAITPAQLTTVRQQNLGSYMEDFFDSKGVLNAGDRARIKQYFNVQYVASFRSLAPEESLLAQTALKDAVEAHPSICPL